MTTNALLSKDPHDTKWELDSASKIFTRTKKITVDKETIDETIQYSLGPKLGEGGGSCVLTLIPNKPGKKIKAVKSKHGGKPLKRLFNEYVMLSILPQGEGLPLPPKGFVKGCIILTKYDCTLESILSNMTPAMKIEAIKQLVNGLLSLHAEGICHCDIRPRNILCLKKNDIMRYDLVDFDESWAYNHPKVKFKGDEYNETSFFQEKQKDIQWLGLDFLNIFYNKITSRESLPLTHESAKEMGLPTYIVDVINYMCDFKNKQKDIKKAKQMLPEI